MAIIIIILALAPFIWIIKKAFEILAKFEQKWCVHDYILTKKGWKCKRCDEYLERRKINAKNKR